MTPAEAVDRVTVLRDRWQALLDTAGGELAQPTPRKVLERCTARLTEILTEVTQ